MAGPEARPLGAVPDVVAETVHRCVREARRLLGGRRLRGDVENRGELPRLDLEPVSELRPPDLLCSLLAARFDQGVRHVRGRADGRGDVSWVQPGALPYPLEP